MPKQQKPTTSPGLGLVKTRKDPNALAQLPPTSRSVAKNKGPLTKGPRFAR